MAPAKPVVLCLPPAGGSMATFRPWLRAPDGAGGDARLEAVNLRLLIHGLRQDPQSAGQPVSLQEVAEALADQLPEDRPFALAGHSLGGLLAYEAALALHRRGARLPAFVLAMGSRPPHRSSADVFAPLIALPDEPFLDALEDVGAVNVALRSSPMRPLFLPALREDLRIITTYRPDSRERQREPLPVPVIAWSGSRDMLAPPDLLEGWERYTLSPRAVQVFDGGHFFPFEEAGACLPALAALCRELLPAVTAR